jgi:hypothetical protein
VATRPDLAGLRIKDPVGPRVYLIDDDGTKRWISDVPTYNALFRDWNGIENIAGTNTIDDGADITVGAVLAKSNQFANVYLIDNGMKRRISNPAVMDKFYFAWNKIQVVPEVVLDFIPSGADIT